MGVKISRYHYKSFVPSRHLFDNNDFLIDTTEHPSAEINLNESAGLDALTNLYNRGYIEAMANSYIEAGINTGLIVCDIDHLKLVNDAFGHYLGDELIATTANRLRKCLKEYPLIGRVGGDEFAVLIPNTTEAETAAVMARINNLQGIKWGSHGFPFSLSTGYAVWSAGKTSEETYHEADDMMYLNKLRNSQNVQQELINSLFGILEARITYEGGHGHRTQELAQAMGNCIGLNPTRLENLSLAAQFHDLGKVRIPEKIIKSPSTLSTTEMELIRRHSAIGYRIALLIPTLAPIADFILKHHESWDGTGYPLGLSGTNIPLECRINLVADAFDAMTTNRPYRPAMTKAEAIGELRRYSGTQFDPTIVQTLIGILG